MLLPDDSNAMRSIRLLIALLGGYAFTAGLAAFLAASLAALGHDAAESTSVGVLAALLTYSVIAIWIVSTKRLRRTAFIVIGAASMMIVSAPAMVQP